MEVFHTVHELKQAVAKERKLGKLIGFVPTMGALHQGHLSLVEMASEICGTVVVSIFVNPTQFNNPNDLKRYPRDLGSDLDLLATTRCNFVFAPSVEEVYPVPDTRKFDFGKIDKVMEGEHRPGHFNGVAQVVSRLFDIVEPDKAFFGQKDFQQLAIVKNLVVQLKTGIEIISCPTVREHDGLAMSSRNQLLLPEQRVNAAHISKVLFEAVKKKGTFNVAELKKWVVDSIDQTQYLKTEYFDIVDDENLTSIDEWSDNVNKVGCIAVHCGEVRLIDNVIF
jgi:pantoate--beta-alanine ligase